MGKCLTANGVGTENLQAEDLTLKILQKEAEIEPA